MILIRVIMLVMALALAAYSYNTAKAQDRSWVDKLQNQQGNFCCYDNDGRRLDDPDWDTLGKVDAHSNGWSGYRVFEDGKWYDVPNWAVVTMRNQDGIARVWWHHENIGSDVVKKVMCFMPAALT